MFHVLTDGTGATEFLKELVKNYLYLVHKEEGLEQITLLPEDMTVQNYMLSRYGEKRKMEIICMSMNLLSQYRQY